MTAQGPHRALLPDGRRLHLQHGPIDLIIEATGSRDEITAAYWQAQQAFGPLLGDLVSELSLLRSAVSEDTPRPQGPVAQRMWQAAYPHLPAFVTPMAAVAGSVADHVLAAAVQDRALRRAYVNNGGDIALHLETGDTFTIGVVANPETLETAGTVTIAGTDPIRGIATSGWRGRSHSLGIADTVTVLAATAAQADVAATLIANSVDLPGSEKVARQPADELDPDSDLRNLPVTVAVEPLSRREIGTALDRGAGLAESMQAAGLIAAAFLCLGGETRCVCGPGSAHALRPPPTTLEGTAYA